MGKMIGTHDYILGYDTGYQEGRHQGYQEGAEEMAAQYEERMAKLNAEIHTLTARVAVLERRV